jgi:hypothetical protein
MGRLAELMAVDMSVTSRHVAHNVERGWVERQPDPLDGRSRLLRLTERGGRQLDTLSEATTRTLEGFLHDWTEEDIARLNGMLERLRDDFGDGATAHVPAAPAPTAPPGSATPGPEPAGPGPAGPEEATDQREHRTALKKS